MQYSNRYNLPDRLVKKLVPKDEHRPDQKRMSVTDLIHPPRMRTLMLARYNEITVDVADLLQMFDGNNLDRAFDDEEFAQLKLEYPIHGLTLVGKLDTMIQDGANLTIIDRKRCKVGGKEYKSTTREWECQLNCYAWLLQQVKGLTTTRLENHIFYKDWTPVRESDPSYPKTAWDMIVQPLWTPEKQREYIEGQLEYHASKPMDCPKEERWGKFAVMSNGRKTANRVCDTIRECEEWMQKNGKGDFIEDRDALRCRFFCNVRSVCKESLSGCLD